MKLLNLAYEKGIVNGFYKCLHEPDWRKRVLVEETVNLLVEHLEERGGSTCRKPDVCVWLCFFFKNREKVGNAGRKTGRFPWENGTYP